ncbi:GNAT family N-acetyltransferase [Streptomyces durbertensis]|uniref:GNAT family N-acetyltransferase n=1 Tax=Streptomyces durbertensis TaxID=2448886 RepID=A0ABR6EJJ3_9ACTN|nr:GNAT family N-acetyltransferase [Streptomyces durbertensis]MBB1245130.1 GNAT family N-acetyltransferase [Streptomyces durbertensis]
METSPASVLTFRTATPDDVPELVALVESAYRGESSRAGWTTEADLLDGRRTDADAVHGLLAGAGSRVLVAERDGEPVACCHLERRERTDGPSPVAYFGMFAVRPTAQGGGLGRRVLAEAERTAADWGATEMQMTVISLREDLIAWYERRGYRRTGRYRPFPYGDEKFGIPRRPDLRFELLVKPLG